MSDRATTPPPTAPKSPRREITPEFDRHAKSAREDKERKKNNKTKINQARTTKYQG